MYARPGRTIHVGKAPQIALAPRVPLVPKSTERHRVGPKISLALPDLMFPLDFLPAPLAKSAPRAPAFERLGSAMRVASEAEKGAPAPAQAAIAVAENVPLPARRPIELNRPHAGSRQVAQATACPDYPGRNELDLR